MNSTVQALRAIPELQAALDSYQPNTQAGPTNALTSEMRRLYQNMSQTTDTIIPLMFLQRLRTVNPQFAEQRPGQGFAQQGEYHISRTITPTHLTDRQMLKSVLVR